MSLKEQYKAAEKLLPWNAKNSVLNAEPHPQKSDDSHFFYRKENRNRDGSISVNWLKVSTIDGSEEDLFYHRKLCELLHRNSLPFTECKLERDVLSFSMDDKDYTFDLVTEELTEKKQKRSRSLSSPDKTKEVFLRRHDLWMRNLSTGEEKQLTFDGKENDAYGEPAQFSGYITDKLKKEPLLPDILWSPDSRFFLSYKLDQKKVKDLYLIKSFDTEGSDCIRPILYTYKCSFPEDEHIPLAYYCLFDTETGEMHKLDLEPQPAGGPMLRTPCSAAKWLEDSSAVYTTLVDRGNKSASFAIVYTDGSVRKVLTETTDTFLNICTYGELDGFGNYRASNYLTSDKKTVLWQSERDDSARLFRYDAENGDDLGAITPKDCMVGNLIHADDENQWIYFYASGLTCTSDPYYQLVCRVHYDGSDFSILTPEDGMHRCAYINGMLIDTWSRVDKTPVTNLRHADGSFIRELVAADAEDLFNRGYVLPERFSVTASDGKTVLYGILIRPADFDPDKKYPVIDYIYGGMQCYNVPKAFSWKGNIKGREMLGGLETMAQLGFVGFILDGLGTPGRGKTLHNISYENIHGCAGLKDHVYCLDEIQKKYPFLDLDRLGIWGNSGGGCGSTRGILEYPNVYKVAVSSAGNHDQRMYNTEWTENYYGLYDKDIYAPGDNTALAKNLKGKLLIVHGAMDDNVAPSQSIRLVDALIREDKDFDFFILPRCNHNVPADPYFIQRRTDYFVEHLLKKKTNYRFKKTE
ncbi:MAG: S9 family peptidase [Oscillospiraceae bacterium]|nr:S9 family peptidase [Oscillospiraceae bacterium]